MKYTVKLMSLALCAAVLLSLPAVAAEAQEETPAIPAPISVWGKVTKQKDGSLLITSTAQDAVNPEVIVRLPEGTPCVDAATGLPLDMTKVKDGDILYAWVGPAMTLSLPPQTTALVVVGNVKPGSVVPQYYEITGLVASATPTVDQPLVVVNFPVAGGETVTVPLSAQFTPWLTRQIVTAGDLMPGSQILVWRDKDGKVEKVLLFPYAYRGYLDTWEPELGTPPSEIPMALSVNESYGTAVQTYNCRRGKDGSEVLAPLRAIAEDAGYDVAWVQGQGAVVKEGGEILFSVLPGSETAVRPGNEDGDWELTSPCLIEKGVTYLPVRDLAMLLNLYFSK